MDFIRVCKALAHGFPTCVQTNVRRGDLEMIGGLFRAGFTIYAWERWVTLITFAILITNFMFGVETLNLI